MFGHCDEAFGRDCSAECPNTRGLVFAFQIEVFHRFRFVSGKI